MSRMLPDPQIQSYRAMRAGAIAFGLPTPSTHVVGVVTLAYVQPIAAQAKSLGAADAVEALAGSPSESCPIGQAFTTSIGIDAPASKSLVAVDSVPALAGNPNESPGIGVSFTTNVV
jgi:hypothetical protein